MGVFPVWLCGATFDRAERARASGEITSAQWDGYRALWRYSAPRFSELVPWPSVRYFNRELDRGATWIGAADVAWRAWESDRVAEQFDAKRATVADVRRAEDRLARAIMRAYRD